MRDPSLGCGTEVQLQELEIWGVRELGLEHGGHRGYRGQGVLTDSADVVSPGREQPRGLVASRDRDFAALGEGVLFPSPHGWWDQALASRLQCGL